MKLLLAVTVAAVSLPSSSGFVAPSNGLASSCKTRVRARTYMSSATEEDDSPQVYVASEIVEDGRKSRYTEKFLDSGVVFQPEIPNEGDGRAGPKDYRGLIDGDTFDGGDGQTGVVGDGTMNMEKFDYNEVVRQQNRVKGESMGGSESKKRQMNAWGANTGYADQLKEKMSKIDEYGEDRLQVRRQQFENYRNQQELQKMQRAKILQLEQITGQDNGSSTWKVGSSRSYIANLGGVQASTEEDSWNSYKPPPAGSRSDGQAWASASVTGTEKLTDVVQCISERGRPGHHTINVKNSVMTFEAFHCEFVDAPDGFSVSPQTGTLNRRNGDPIPVTVSYKPKGPGDQRDATLVIETEEDKWVYRVEGRTN